MAVGKKIGILDLQSWNTIFAVSQPNSVVGFVFLGCFEVFNEVDVSRHCTSVARKKTAVVPSDKIPFVETAYSPGLKFRNSDVHRFIQRSHAHSIPVNESILQQNKEVGRDLSHHPVLIVDFEGLFEFRESVVDQDRALALADNVVLIVEKLSYGLFEV